MAYVNICVQVKHTSEYKAGSDRNKIPFTNCSIARNNKPTKFNSKVYTKTIVNDLGILKHYDRHDAIKLRCDFVENR